MSEKLIWTTVPTMHSDLMHKLHMGSRKLWWNAAELQVLNSEINHLKEDCDRHFYQALYHWTLRFEVAF